MVFEGLSFGEKTKKNDEKQRTQALVQKIRKIIRAVSEKRALPTNQILPTTPILKDLADAGPKTFYLF